MITILAMIAMIMAHSTQNIGISIIINCTDHQFRDDAVWPKKHHTQQLEILKIRKLKRKLTVKMTKERKKVKKMANDFSQDLSHVSEKLCCCG